MSPVSKRVASFGFLADPKTSNAIEKAFSKFASLAIHGSTVQEEVLRDISGIVIGPNFDFDSERNFQLLTGAVEDGKNIVVIGYPVIENSEQWSKLFGAFPVQSKPDTEWFFKLSPPETAQIHRVAKEFAAVGVLTILEPTSDATSLLYTNIGFTDFTTGTIRRIGNSQVTTIGLNPKSSIWQQDFATLVRRSLFGDMNGNSITDRTLGIGIVGYGPYGGMGHYHGRAATETDGLNLVAVVDRDAERRKAAESEFPNVRTYKTTQELINDSEVDVCIVATPPISHAEISLALLSANKHVICEKPMCITFDEARELIAKSQEMNKMLTINQNRRWDRDFVAARRAINQGKIGELFNVETFVGGYEHPCRAWHSELSISGGAIYDWGSHHIDQIVQLYGSTPSQVSAIGHKRVWEDVSNVDQIRVRMLWEDGREAEFFQSDIAAIRKPKYFIQGTLGTISGEYRPIVEENVGFPFGYEEHEFHHAEAPAVLKLSRYESGYGIIEESLPAAPPQKFAFHRNIADHLIYGEPLEVTPEEVANVVGVMEAAQLSSISGSQYIKPSRL